MSGDINNLLSLLLFRKIKTKLWKFNTLYFIAHNYLYFMSAAMIKLQVVAQSPVREMYSVANNYKELKKSISRQTRPNSF